MIIHVGPSPAMIWRALTSPARLWRWCWAPVPCDVPGSVPPLTAMPTVAYSSGVLAQPPMVFKAEGIITEEQCERFSRAVSLCQTAEQARAVTASLTGEQHERLVTSHLDSDYGIWMTTEETGYPLRRHQ